MLDHILTKQIIGPFIIVLAAFTVYSIISKIISKMFKIRLGKSSTKHQDTIANIINNLTKYFIIIISILMILDIYGVDTKGLVASLGVLGLAIGLAVQDLLKDFVAGMSIIFESQYRAGDTVTIGSFKGEVVYLGIKTTRLKSATGEVKIIANRNITEVINHTIENAIIVIEIIAPTDTEIEQFEKVLKEISLNIHEKVPNVKGKAQYLGLSEIELLGMVFKITATTSPMKRYEVQRNIIRELKLELDKQNIIPTENLVVRNG